MCPKKSYSFLALVGLNPQLSCWKVFRNPESLQLSWLISEGKASQFLSPPLIHLSRPLYQEHSGKQES